MATKGDCLKLYLRLIDEATKKGIELSETKNADYRDKFNYFLNESLKYMAGLIKIPALYQVTHNPIPNQLGLLSGFDIRQYLPGKPIILTGVGTKSYHFEIDNIGTVTIAVNGVTVDTIENTVKRIFTAHKGNITATDTDIVTVTFGGDYPYNIRDTAIFAYNFATDDDVPDYTRYVEYAMPDDFMSFDTVILRSDPAIYEIYKGMKWENNKKVILEYFRPGSFDIHYYRYPETIAYNAADTTELDIEDKGVDLLALDIAIRATAADNPSLSSWLRSLFIEKAQNIIGEDVAQETRIETVYSIMG